MPGCPLTLYLGAIWERHCRANEVNMACKGRAGSWMAWLAARQDWGRVSRQAQVSRVARHYKLPAQKDAH